MRCLLIFIATTALLSNTSAPAQQAPNKSELEQLRNHAEKDVVLAEQRYREAEEAVASLNNRLREESGLSNVEAADLRHLISALQEQREAMQLEEAAATGRRQGIEEAVKSFSDQVKKRAADDEVTSELAKLVNVRQAQLDRIHQEQKPGVERRAASDDAEAALATARAEYAAARQRAAASANDAIDAWNRELLNLAVAGQERRAKLQYIQDRLKALPPALLDLDKLEQVQRERQRLEAELTEARAKLRILER